MQMASCIILQSLCFYAIRQSFDRAKTRRRDDDLKTGWEKVCPRIHFLLDKPQHLVAYSRWLH